MLTISNEELQNQYTLLNKEISLFIPIISKYDTLVSSLEDYYDIDELNNNYSSDKKEKILANIKNAFSIVFHKLSGITTRIFKILRNGAERAILSNSKIIELWNNRLATNLSSIDNDEFSKTIVHCCNKDEYKKRIQCLIQLGNFLDKTESVIDAKDEKEITNMISMIRSIGFDTTNGNFIQANHKAYESKMTKDTIANHDFDLHSLQELLESTKLISKYASKDYVNKINKHFSNVYKHLTDQEESANHLSDIKQKKAILDSINSKIAKLWWMSNFINTIFKIADDTIKQIWQIYKAAEKAIDVEAEETLNLSYKNLKKK